MLEPWIIEQIRRREEEERRRQDQPRLEVPVRDERWRPESDRQEKDEDEDAENDQPQRGVIIIDM